MIQINLAKTSKKTKIILLILFVVIILLSAILAYSMGNPIEELIDACYDSSYSHCYNSEIMEDGYYKIIIDSTYSLNEKQLLDSTSSFFKDVRKEVKKKNIQGFWLLFVNASSFEVTLEYSALIQRNDILNVNLNNVKTYEEFKNLIRWQ